MIILPYEKKKIKAVIEDINSGKMYLPAIQRKYVWSEEQIVRLFDSILLNYPIGTFLFWKVSGKTINSKQYSLYEFIRDYHERDTTTNPHAPNPIVKDEITGVLDGQQRLTSLYIALQGSMAFKLPMKRWSNNEAFPIKELYMNLAYKNEKSDDEDLTYEFDFIHKNDKKLNDNGKVWFKVKEAMVFNSDDDVDELIDIKGWSDKTVRQNIRTLYRSIASEDIINYFEVRKENIDDVLDIFVRVNSGGTVLSKSDLLFSTIVSHWDKARDEIEDLLKTINSIGEHFKFTNDFIMRTCVYILDLSVSLKVENFKKDSVVLIKNNWDKIKNSIIETVKLLNEFGFSADNMISYVAASPIVYYKYHGGSFNGTNRDELRKYIVIAQVKQIFGAANTSALTNIRDVLKTHNTSFSLSYFSSLKFAGERNLRFTVEEIYNLFDLNIGAYTFMVLSLLYPNLKYSQKGFHQDHMHPYAGFNNKMLTSLGLSDEAKERWLINRNKLANLQLLEGRENESKNVTPLCEWLQKDDNKKNVLFLPDDVSYELKDFDTFYERRIELMANKLKEILL